MALTPEELKKVTAQLKAQADLQRKLSEDTNSYFELIKDIKNLHKDIAASKQKMVEQEANSLSATKAYNDALASGNRLTQTQYNLLKKNKDLEDAKLGIIRDEVKELEKLTGEMTKAAKEAKGLQHTFASMKKSVNDIGGGFKMVAGFFKEMTGGFGNLKEIKRAGLSMGLLKKGTDDFGNSVNAAGAQVAAMGVSMDDLSKMQASYSDELGRAVMLGKEGLIAMGQMAAATGLGAEGASKMAADMDTFGLSAEKTRDLMEATMNDSHAIGLNASKVIKNMAGNMKMMNKYSFKGGTKGLEKMALTVTKLGVKMDFVASMADKLFNVEGAVEMSAQLQVLGGAWAQFADPMKMMNLGRNDMEGLAKATANAAAQSVSFNSATGEFKITALEMHTLREAANATGVSYEELAESGMKAKKALEAKKLLQIGGLSSEMEEFIANTAQWKDGKATIEIGGQTRLLKTLTDIDKTAIKNEIKSKASLKERAEMSKTFDEKISNIIMQFKQMFYPFVKAVDEGLGPIADKISKALANPKLLEGIKSAAETAGKVIAVIGKFIANNPGTSIALAFGTMGLMEAVKWIANGVALGKGFNMVASVGGRGGSGGIMDMFGGGKGGRGGGGMMKGLSSLVGGKKTMMGRGMRGMAAKQIGGGAMGGLGKMGMGLGLGVAGMGMDYARGGMDDSQSTGGKMLGIGSKAAEWAAMGSMLGPWGALIGGILGAGKGTYDEYFDADAQIASAMPSGVGGVHDGAFSDGKGIIQGGKITPIDNKDDLMAMKPNGPVDKAINGGGMNGGTMKIEFGEIHFKFDELKVTSPGSPGVTIDLLKDPKFIRSITTMIHNETNKMVNGGALKP